jgi:uncharacterized protein YndB with AHSA1/START domain
LVANRIEREILIEAPIDVVWAVVTEPEHIKGWFSDTVELELTPGGKLALHWDDHGTVDGRVERVEPPRLFSFRWAVGPGAPDSTLVEFHLSAEGAATRLTVLESGFLEQQDVDSHRRGWELELGELRDYAGRR